MKFHVALSLYFRRTLKASKEPNPTPEQLNAYMLENARYKEFANSFKYVYGRVQSPSYEDGVLSFTLVANDEQMTGDELKTLLLKDSLEDGLYEAYPGSAAVYPSQEDTDVELGVIDYRILENIEVHEMAPTTRRKSPQRRSSPRSHTCSPGKIHNPQTGRCVLVKGRIGQRLLRSYAHLRRRSSVA